MDSFKDVLEAAQAYCKTQMAEPTYNLYIDGLEPISFEDSSHITLSVRNDFICKIVTDRYLGLLKEAFKTVLGFDVDITLVVPSTPPHEVVLAQQYEANPASPQGNYEFTFENFIKGPSNQFAFAAAQAVAANPSGAYNPLFIYGGSGLGKTHLLTAIQTEIKRTHPDFVIMYVTCEQFTNELIAAIRAGDLYGLKVAAAGIQDSCQNRTRFLVLGQQKTHRRGGDGGDKTTFIFAVRNRAGALFEILKPLADEKVDMLHLESRPARNGLWEYNFFVDISGHVEDEAVRRALEAVRKNALVFKFLGSYPRAAD